MQIALAGRPGAGKSSLMELLAGGTAERDQAARGGLRVSHVEVPDWRLFKLSEVFRPKKTTPARLAFEDLEQKSGPTYPALSPERRAMLAQADLVLLVCDLYAEDPDDWDASIQAQWQAALDEFTITDLSIVEARLEKLTKSLRIGNPPAFPGEPELLQSLHRSLEEGRPVLATGLTTEEERATRGYSFLSARPMLPALNVSEERLQEARSRYPSRVLFCAPVESQILEMPPDEQSGFLEAFGLAEPAVAQIIRASYDLAGLHCFFTVGEDEVRAWSVRKGARAPEAAGAIHSDLEKGFVRAEVVSFTDWQQFGSIAAAREKGAFRLEGKEYVVRDGDILNIRSGLAKSRA